MKKICPGFFLDKQPKSSKGIFYNIDVFSQKITLLVNFNFREALRIYKNKCDVWSSPNQSKNQLEFTLNIIETKVQISNVKSTKFTKFTFWSLCCFFSQSCIKVPVAPKVWAQLQSQSHCHKAPLHGMTSSCQEP
jgi:hypothetical protein